MGVILQIALDFKELERAVSIAEASKDGADWIEAGTPLIKSVGMDCVRELRKKFPDKKIVADLKIADVGDVETEMAAKSGADIVTVLATSSDCTIRNCVKTAKNYGCEVMADTIGFKGIEKRSKELEKLGVDYIAVHTPIDDQMLNKDSFDGIMKVAKSVHIPVAACGGLSEATIPKAVKSGASIVIVGNAITKSKNPGKAAAAVKAATKKTSSDVKQKSVLEILKQVSTSNVSDAMHRSGEMMGLKPVYFEKKIVGKAVTVKCYPGDWSKTVQAIDSAEKGDIIVIDEHGSHIAVWGGLASRSAKNKGIAAVVIDGGIRDVDEINKLQFPSFARHVTPTAGEPKGMGEINVSVRCGNIFVSPGDYIVIDESGIVVIPKNRALEIANRALYIKEKEDRITKEIDDGKTLGKVLNLKGWDKLSYS